MVKVAVTAGLIDKEIRTDSKIFRSFIKRTALVFMGLNRSKRMCAANEITNNMPDHRAGSISGPDLLLGNKGARIMSLMQYRM